METYDGYRFDEYARLVEDESYSIVMSARDRLPSPIRELWLAGMQYELQASVVVVVGGTDGYEEFELGGPPTPIPQFVDFADDDQLLTGFYQQHGLDPEADRGDDEDEDAFPAWPSPYALPYAALIHELIQAAERLGSRLREAGLAVAEDCLYCAGDHDSRHGDADVWQKIVRERFNALPEPQRADLVALCYASEEKRRQMTAP
jgi:hypothetical protein